MIDVQACPICGSSELRTVGRSAYDRRPPPATGDAGRDWASGVQREFVFTHWLPGADRVELLELLCERCGFVCASPRPTAADVARKYETLRDAGVALGHSAPVSRGDAYRARVLHRRLAGELALDRARVLDIGGGDGRLISGLAASGAACFVVDYATSTLPEVTRLGDTVDDLSPGERFDVAVLSHVLEHVADPVGLLRAAGEIATHVYAEVPVELWRGTPIAVDPVTHVNHFTEHSLRFAARQAGWAVRRSRTTFSVYGDRPLEVAWLVGRRGRDPQADAAPARETLRRLDPGPAARLRRRARWALRPARRG